jgi:hypothetical protein
MTKNDIPKIKGLCREFKLLSVQAELRVPFCRFGINVTTSSPSHNAGNNVLQKKEHHVAALLIFWMRIS